VLRSYGINRVSGDRYAGEWPREQFRKHGIAYEPSVKPKTDLYRDLLPLLNSRRVALLDNSRLTTQLVGLERRTARGGRDSIDHGPGAHDDLANCVAGVLTTVSGRQRRIRTGVFGYGGPATETDPTTGRLIDQTPARIRWVKVQEADAPAARGPN
jgi:hypothetical protein